MERYSAIKQLAVTSAELIEQVQFDDHQGKPEKIEPLLARIITLALAASRRPGSLKNKLVSERKHGKRRKIGKNLLFFVFKAAKSNFQRIL